VTPHDESEHDPLGDLLLIERVLYALWAPNDVSPSTPAIVAPDGTGDQLTVHHVIRARRAADRLMTAAQKAPR
jgi:hypothetical protein